MFPNTNLPLKWFANTNLDMKTYEMSTNNLIVNKQFVWEQFLTIIQIILTVSEEAEKTGIGLTQDKQ